MYSVCKLVRCLGLHWYLRLDGCSVLVWICLVALVFTLFGCCVLIARILFVSFDLCVNLLLGIYLFCWVVDCFGLLFIVT